MRFISAMRLLFCFYEQRDLQARTQDRDGQLSLLLAVILINPARSSSEIVFSYSRIYQYKAIVVRVVVLRARSRFLVLSTIEASYFFVYTPESWIMLIRIILVSEYYIDIMLTNLISTNLRAFPMYMFCPLILHGCYTFAYIYTLCYCKTLW